MAPSLSPASVAFSVKKKYTLSLSLSSLSGMRWAAMNFGSAEGDVKMERRGCQHARQHSIKKIGSLSYSWALLTAWHCLMCTDEDCHHHIYSSQQRNLENVSFVLCRKSVQKIFPAKCGPHDDSKCVWFASSYIINWKSLVKWTWSFFSLLIECTITGW